MKRILFPLLWACVTLPVVQAAPDQVIQKVIEHALAHPRGDAACSFDRAVYLGDISGLPIGIFDSGIGGLTVLEAILSMDAFNNENLQPGADGKPDFEREKFVYFGDQANMPYGNYPAADRTDYLRELIAKDAVFLLGRRYWDQDKPQLTKPPVKAIVIACNTATAYGLDDLRACVDAWQLPVIVLGVIEAGARGVKELHQPGSGTVGVLATVGTCASGAYPKMIGAALGLAGRELPGIVQHGSAGLAGVIEGDPAFVKSLAEQALEDVRALVDANGGAPNAQPLSTVVLGCTHYPLARREIDKAFDKLRGEEGYEGRIAPEITYVNPAEWTAKELFRELARTRLRARRGAASATSFYISVANKAAAEAKLTPEGVLETNYKYGREPGKLGTEDTINVPLRVGMLPPVGRSLVEQKLPRVWRLLTEDGQ